MANRIINNTGTVSISTANTNLNGTGVITTLFTANGTYGSMLNTIRVNSITAIQSGMLRFFMKSSLAGSWTLLKEIPIPETPLANPPYPAYASTIEVNLEMANGYIIGVASQTNDTFLINAFGYDITGFI